MVCPVRGTGGTQEKFEEDTRREAERAEDRAASLAPVRTFATGKHRNDWLESWRSNSPCFTSPAFSGKRAKRKQARRSVYSIESVATACRDSLRSTRHESSCEACRNEARAEFRERGVQDACQRGISGCMEPARSERPGAHLAVIRRGPTVGAVITRRENRPGSGQRQWNSSDGDFAHGNNSAICIRSRWIGRRFQSVSVTGNGLMFDRGVLPIGGSDLI